MSVILEAKNICFAHQGKRVLQKVSIDLCSEERIGLLGFNGAGKSTLIRILGGLVPSQIDSLSLHGKAIDSTRRLQTKIGYVPDQAPIYQDMKTLEYLTFCFSLFNLKVNHALLDDLLTMFDCQDIRHHRLSTLSSGFLQRISLVRSLLHQPDIWLLDEPTNGLDLPQSEKIRQLILENMPVKTMLIASHLMDDIRLCDRIYFLHQQTLREIDSGDLNLNALKKYMAE